MSKITMAHGSGGMATTELINNIFANAFDNPTLDAMEDAAVVAGSEKIAVTTDSFVVKPLFFPGSDIGRLAVCGTVNDLLMRGAVPKYITSAFIIEEGMEEEDLKKIVKSMADTASEAGVQVICGDTKVVEGTGGVMINTTGVGFVNSNVSIKNATDTDVIIVSGNMGDHHAAILSSRMGISNTIISDAAPLREMVLALLDAKIKVHSLRDITRGGLATVCKEIAENAGVTIEIEDEKIPVDPQVRDFCSLMGLDPLYMGNEGKLIAFVAKEDAKKALEIIRASKYGSDAAIIGNVTMDKPGMAYSKTALGSKRVLDLMYGEGLPRIC